MDKAIDNRKELQGEAAGMLEVVEADVHSIVQRELANIAMIQVEEEDLKKHYKKDPSKRIKDMAELVKLDQNIKQGGFGNAASKNLTININGLGVSEKMKLFDELKDEVASLGKKLGIESKTVNVTDTKANVRNKSEQSES